MRQSNHHKQSAPLGLKPTKLHIISSPNKKYFLTEKRLKEFLQRDSRNGRSFIQAAVFTEFSDELFLSSDFMDMRDLTPEEKASFMEEKYEDYISLMRLSSLL